jgi:cell division protein FtsZ
MMHPKGGNTLFAVPPPTVPAVATKTVAPVSSKMEGPAAVAASASKSEQPEFGFGEIESRGNFEKTDRYLFDGQDLDVPTYLRRGIKIVI